jgi:hypothetical protein
MFYSKWFGKAISYLILGGDELDIKTVVGNTLTNKMIINLNMFSPGMKHWIYRQECSTQIITPQTRLLYELHS